MPRALLRVYSPSSASKLLSQWLFVSFCLESFCDLVSYGLGQLLCVFWVQVCPLTPSEHCELLAPFALCPYLWPGNDMKVHMWHDLRGRSTIVLNDVPILYPCRFAQGRRQNVEVEAEFARLGRCSFGKLGRMPSWTEKQMPSTQGHDVEERDDDGGGQDDVSFGIRPSQTWRKDSCFLGRRIAWVVCDVELSYAAEWAIIIAVRLVRAVE